MRALCVCVLLAACTTPGVAPGLDVACDGGACPDTGAIQGSLVSAGPARGDAILLLFDTAALPPPDGTATSAVAVARVSAQQLFGSAAAGAQGPFAAPFTFTQVPPGRSYQIRAFLDVAHAFDPLFDFTTSPRAGDVAGGYGQIGANGQAQLLAIPVASGQVVTGVNVALTQAVPFDPPSFVIAGGSATLDANLSQPAPLTLQIRKLSAPDASFAAAHFAVELDRDASGNAQDTFGDGLTDVFPRVILQQLSDESGAPVSDAAIVPCRTNPVPVLPAVLALPQGATPLPRDTLQVFVEPFALRSSDRTPLPQIPPGQYQVVVIEKSGQVWTLPNSLGSTARAQTADSDATQGETVTFAASKLPAGGISGTITFHGDASIASGNLIVQAYRADPLNPPPPLGAAQPVRVQVIFASQVTKTASGFSAPYALSGLPPGNYEVEALDDVDGNFGPLAILQTPTRNDLTGALVDTYLRPKVIGVSDSVVTLQDVELTGPVGLDPPAFTVSGAATLAADAVQPARFDLLAHPVSFPAGAVSQPVFTVSLVRDQNGATVDSDGDGLPDVWPRIFLVRLDSDDPSGLTLYKDLVGQPHTEVIPAAVDPTPFLPALLAQGAPQTLLATRVSVIARPALVDVTNTAEETRMPLAPGSYRIVVINETGQAWQEPNEAGPLALDPSVVCSALPCPAGTVQTQAQGEAFTVGLPARPLVQGIITGSLQLGSVPFDSAYIFAYDAANPPPPAGTGTPVSADFHQAREAVNGVLSFALPDLPVGTYIVTALVDTRGDFAVAPALYGLAPGEGDLAIEYAGGPITLTDARPFQSGIVLDAGAAVSLPARPSFVFGSSGTPVTTDLALAPPQKLTVHAEQILDARVAVNPEPDAPKFFVSYQACDASNKPVDADGDGLPDVWPRVFVQKLSDADPTGLLPDPTTTLIAAAVNPTGLALGNCAAHTVVPVSNLTVQVEPVAVRIVNGTRTQEAVPPGRYGLLVMQSTGQSWRVPNELQPLLLDPRSAAALPGLATQGVALRVAGP